MKSAFEKELNDESRTFTDHQRATLEGFDEVDFEIFKRHMNNLMDSIQHMTGFLADKKMGTIPPLEVSFVLILLAFKMPHITQTPLMMQGMKNMMQLIDETLTGEPAFQDFPGFPSLKR